MINLLPFTDILPYIVICFANLKYRSIVYQFHDGQVVYGGVDITVR